MSCVRLFIDSFSSFLLNPRSMLIPCPFVLFMQSRRSQTSPRGTMASLRGRSARFLPLFHRQRLRSRRERAGRLRPIHQRDGEHITLAFVARERVSRSNLHSSLLQPTQRTPDESRNHFRLRRNAFFDYRVSQLKEEAVFVDGASSSMNLGDVKGKESEKEVVER